MITADCHLHSSFSGDSDTPMEEMVLQGIAQGLDTMCFTEHNDFEYPDAEDLDGKLFLLNGSLTPKNFEITRKASNGFIFLSNLYFLLPRYS